MTFGALFIPPIYIIYSVYKYTNTNCIVSCNLHVWLRWLNCSRELKQYRPVFNQWCPNDRPITFEAKPLNCFSGIFCGNLEYVTSFEHLTIFLPSKCARMWSEYMYGMLFNKLFFFINIFRLIEFWQQLREYVNLKFEKFTHFIYADKTALIGAF